MTTLEMLNQAQKDNQVYGIYNLCYQKDKGFYSKITGSKWNASAFKFVDDIFKIDNWELLSCQKMTIKEIEDKLGYPIEIVSE